MKVYELNNSGNLLNSREVEKAIMTTVRSMIKNEIRSFNIRRWG
jgi:hypothetical protein